MNDNSRLFPQFLPPGSQGPGVKFLQQLLQAITVKGVKLNTAKLVADADGGANPEAVVKEL